MNGLAFEHYVDRPWYIFQGWHAARFNEVLAETVNAANKAKRSLDRLTVARLRWYPALFSDLVVTGQISRPDVEAVLSTPTARFQAMANHYAELAPVLESKLLEDSESAERIIRWLRFKDITPFRAEVEYFTCLGDDPNRHYRLTPAAERPEREKMSAQASVKKTTNAAWAYLFVSCNSIATLDSALVEVLAQSEEYSYLTALVLRKRGFGPEVWQSLLGAVTSHRWAFHALRDLEPGTKIESTTVQRLLRIVHSSPPWAVQLWQDRGWRGQQLSWAYGECVKHADGHECVPELHSWFRYAQATAGVKTAVAA